MEKEAPVIVAKTWMNSEASVIKSLLESYDIPCDYASELPQRFYPLSVEGRIYVPASVAQDARRILDEYRRNHTLRLVDY